MPKFTRNVYVKVTEVIKSAHEETDAEFASKTDSTPEDVSQYMSRTIADNLATIFKMDNTRFDKDKFLKACGF